MKDKIFKIVSLTRLHDCLAHTEDFIGKKISVRKISQELPSDRIDGEFRMEEDVFPHKKKGDIVFIYGASLQEA